MDHSQELQIGTKIKELRLAKSMKLRDLSELTDLSISYLSQVERGVSALTIHALEKIANAFGVEVSVFFARHLLEARHIVRSFEQEIRPAAEQRSYYSPLSHQTEQLALQPQLVSILPAGVAEPPPGRRTGEDFLHVLEGVLTVVLGQEEYQLNPGDSIYYAVTPGLQWCNRTKQPVRLLNISYGITNG